MRSVFTSSEIAHIWAHQKAPHGRAPSAVSFDGPSLRSYSTTIAILAGDAVWLNSKRYSNTTSKHQGAVCSATSHFAHRFFVPFEPHSEPAHNVRELLNHALDAKIGAEEMAEKYPRRKSQVAAYNANCMTLIDTAQRANDHFGTGIDCSLAGLDELKKRHEQAQKAAQAAEEKRRKAQERKARENLKRWLAGDESVNEYNLPTGQTFLRTKGDVVETSKGITIPIQEARDGIAFVFSKRAEGWHRNGETYPIAGYQLDSVNVEGVVAGCHRLTWKELERFQKLIA